ncbi:hypothetical protein ACGFIR_21190 [Micromonospora sp. NPDC049051]|uniref:hypothetical protein n=1 Tax=Micromonospora sp. NPDC049051 TaxID=3364264 RepID=UPI0037142A6B
MTYDIHLVRRRAGRTLSETLDDISATYDPQEPSLMELGVNERTAWERVTRRAATELGPITVEEYPTTLTLWRDGPSTFYQLDYDGTSASIEIPYRYPGAAALPVAEEAYRLARIVEEETGLEGFDAEVGQDIRQGDPQTAAMKLGGISRWAAENLSANAPTGPEHP